MRYCTCRSILSYFLVFKLVLYSESFYNSSSGKITKSGKLVCLRNPMSTHNYQLCIQSIRFDDTIPISDGEELRKLLKHNLHSHVSLASENLAYKIFPDHAFGFSINDQFVENFHGIFLTTAGTFDQDHFASDEATAYFLNRVITTLACFLHEAGQGQIKPLRYFTVLHASKPIAGLVHHKPDIVLARLLNGYTQLGPFQWKDVQALVEHMTSKKPPSHMVNTVTDKNYLMFCAQPEKDFIISLCITGTGSHIVISDHAGQVETDVIPFDQTSATIIFL